MTLYVCVYLCVATRFDLPCSVSLSPLYLAVPTICAIHSTRWFHARPGVATLWHNCGPILVNFDTAFSIIFLFEFISKIIAMGFVIHKNSYLRDAWNWLDFFIVMVSVISWLPFVDAG